MNTNITSNRIITALAVPEGAGVTVHRTVGTPALRNLDPFMLLDHFGSDDPDDYIAGFPSHPHRGFSTFTHMIDGYTEHKDSMGNTGNLGPGAAQLMKAASGIIHSEMPKQEDGLMRGFQLWINLPSAHKMDHPEYQEYGAEAFPVIENDEYRLKVLIGEYESIHSPIADDITQVQYYDVELKPGQRFQHLLPKKNNSFIYVFEGNGKLRDQFVGEHMLVTFGGDSSHIDFVAGEHGARFIITSGKPINEPAVQYGPFVMNTREEIDRAMRDFQTNNFIRHKAWMKREKTTWSAGGNL